MSCVFCHRPKPSISRTDELEWFICGTCTQRLLNATPEAKQQAYDLAVKEGFDKKADALKSFMEGEKIEQRNPKRDTAKCSHRKRPTGFARNEQRSAWKAPQRKAPALHKIDRPEQAIL